MAEREGDGMSEGKDERTVHERMVAIIDELPAIGKTQRNEQQKFNFRGHDDVLNALTPLLAKHGVVIVPHVLERVTDKRETRSGSVMYEVNLHIQYTFYGASGDSVAGSAWGEGTDMGDKATMKAGTMAFKAILNQAFAINTEEGARHDTDKGAVEETVAQSDKMPRTWVEVNTRGHDQLGDDWPLWIEQVKVWAKSVKVDGKMPPPTLLQRMGAVVADLEETGNDWAFTVGPRPLIQAIFAKHLDGEVLAGPEHRLNGDEPRSVEEAELDQLWEESAK